MLLVIYGVIGEGKMVLLSKVVFWVFNFYI